MGKYKVVKFMNIITWLPPPGPLSRSNSLWLRSPPPGILWNQIEAQTWPLGLQTPGTGEPTPYPIGTMDLMIFSYSKSSTQENNQEINHVKGNQEISQEGWRSPQTRGSRRSWWSRPWRRPPQEESLIKEEDYQEEDNQEGRQEACQEEPQEENLQEVKTDRTGDDLRLTLTLFYSYFF